MPNDQHITDHFTVMDTSEKSVFLYVSNDKVLDPVGNLFVSDGLGYRFTHSLENIIKAVAQIFNLKRFCMEHLSLINMTLIME